MTRDDLTTPVLIVDLDVMERNLERMATFFRTGSTRLRPHFKNHKCPDLAWRQLDAGAIGMTCATLGEAECLVHHGIRSVLLANEIVDSAKIRRFVDLARRADVIVCIDDEKDRCRDRARGRQPANAGERACRRGYGPASLRRTSGRACNRSGSQGG